jgi:hypothetical protein
VEEPTASITMKYKDQHYLIVEVLFVMMPESAKCNEQQWFSSKNRYEKTQAKDPKYSWLDKPGEKQS